MMHSTVSKRSIVSWVLYDLGNTIFSMGVISLMFPLWVRDAVGTVRADTSCGLIIGISMAIIFVISPLLGAMTDHGPRRLQFLVVSTLLCVAATAFLGRGGFLLTAFLFIVANVCYQAGTQFYDALLPEVSTDENRGRIGGIGVGVGYLGSYVAVGVSLIAEEHSKSFLFMALAFLVFAIPCFFS